MTNSPDHKSKVLPVLLDPETQELLRRLKAKLGLSRAALIRMSIRRLADRLELLDREHPDKF